MMRLNSPLKWGCGATGSAGALQAQGWGFESPLLHQLKGRYSKF